MQSAIAIGLPISKSPSILTVLAGAPRQVVSWIGRCAARANQRQALFEMDERMLKDIGITRYEAVFEAQKPFWRA